VGCIVSSLSKDSESSDNEMIGGLGLEGKSSLEVEFVDLDVQRV
jgi:hypothetical protein